jgi:hypothetical protein
MGAKMARSALTQLQDQIEAIRREAYDAGYAAAMQAIRDFVARPAAAAPATAPRGRGPAKAPAAKPAARQAVVRKRSRPQRGANANLIAEVLKAMPSGTARPAEIRKVLQNDKGVAMAFTSIRHALGQLAQRNEATVTGDGKTWRYTGAA